MIGGRIDEIDAAAAADGDAVVGGKRRRCGKRSELWLPLMLQMLLLLLLKSKTIDRFQLRDARSQSLVLGIESIVQGVEDFAVFRTAVARRC